MQVQSAEEFDLTDFYRDYDVLAVEPTMEAPDFVSAGTRGAAGGAARAHSYAEPGGLYAVPAVGTHLPEISATALPAAVSTPETASYKLEKQRERNRQKKQKRRDKLDNGDHGAQQRRAQFLAGSTANRSEGFELDASRRSESGYVGVVDRGIDFAFLSGTGNKRLACLLLQGYELVEFERSKYDTPFCDSNGRVFAVVLGWPAGWEQRTTRTNAAMERLQDALKGNAPPPNRRGPFAAYAIGYSFGGGRTVPSPFKRGAKEGAAINEFMSDPDVQSVFKYIRGAMKTWFPQHVERYDSCIKLYSDLLSLQPPSALPFPAMTLNVGRYTVCGPHRDSPNDAAGACLDYILGKFNHRAGGHLVLHEARRVLSLEPGRALLFPSALITHETIPIAQSEWRSGVTGYAPGGLWRFANQGFQRRWEWEGRATGPELAQHDAEGTLRWQEGLQRFMTIEELETRMDTVAELLVQNAEPIPLSKKIVRLVQGDEDALQRLIHELETRDAVSQLAQLLPHLPLSITHRLFEFESFRFLIARDPTCMPDELLADFLRVCRHPDWKMFIQYMPAKRAAGLLSRFCPDLVSAFSFLADMGLPDDVENAILADFRAETHAGGAVAAQPSERRSASEELPVASSPAVTATPNVPATDLPPATTLPTPPERPPKPAPPAAAATRPATSTHIVPAPPADRKASAPGRARRATAKQQRPPASAPLTGSDEDSGSQPSSEDDSANSYVPTSPKPSHRAPQRELRSAQASTTPLRPSVVSAHPTTATPANTASDEGQETRIYGDVRIRSVEEHRRRWERKMNQAMWDSLQGSPGFYEDSDSEPGKWPSIIAKHQPNNTDAVDLPPVIDQETQDLRAAQWGEQHSAILAFEKEQFLALPALIRKCSGQVNSSRNKGDIYLRRFWAPYAMVNVCIEDKESLTTANAEIIEYTLLRFNHLAEPLGTGDAKSSKWRDPIRSCLNTFKSRVAKALKEGNVEPKVKKQQMQRALSFVSGELRRCGAASLWASKDGLSLVTAEVNERLDSFAAEKHLPLTDKTVQAQRLGFRSSASALLFRQQAESVQQEYKAMAQDPSMSSSDFADASAPMLRSFVDAVTDETEALAVVMYAVKTSQGPLVIVSQHGEQLKDRSFLQTKGTDFVKPFVEVASSIFKVDTGELGVVTAAAAVPAEEVPHPWTQKKTAALSAPKFQLPVNTDNKAYNAKVLAKSILESIRMYTGQAPSFGAVVSNPAQYILEGTQPTYLLDPSAMPVPMLSEWVDHWLQSADPDSSIPHNKRLRFVGQALYESMLPLHDAAQDEAMDTDEEAYQPPRASKRSSKKAESGPPIKPKPKPKPKPKSKGKGKAAEVPAAAPAIARRPPQTEVYVDVPPFRTPRKAPSHARSIQSDREGAQVLLHGAETVSSSPAEPSPFPAATSPFDRQPPDHAQPNSPTPTPCRSPSSVEMDTDEPPHQPGPYAFPPARQQASALVPYEYSSDVDSPPPTQFARPVESKPDLVMEAPDSTDSGLEAAGAAAAALRARTALALTTSSAADSSASARAPSAAPLSEHAPSVPNEEDNQQVPIQAEVRQGRQAQVVLKHPVQYTFSDAETPSTIADKVSLWAQAIQRRITNEVMAAGNWEVEHSGQSSTPLAHLMHATAILEWYSVCKPAPADRARPEAQLLLSFPWTNVSANSPPHRLYQVLLNVADSVPIITFLLSRDGGWSPADIGLFAEGLAHSISSALAQGIGHSGDLPVSPVSAIPLGRALVLLRQTRSVSRAQAEYCGPTEDRINAITDKVILILNALAVIRFLYHSVLPSVMQLGSSYPVTSPRGVLWQRYHDCMLCIIDSVASTVSAQRSDFFSSNLLSSLPPALHTLAQTISAESKWWYRFSDGPAAKPKALSFSSRGNIFANKLPEWAESLTEDAWLKLTGLDRAVVGIIASVALSQVSQLHADERKTWDTCASLLLHLQVITTRCRQGRLESDGGPILPAPALSTARGQTQWPRDHRWAAASDATAVKVPIVEPCNQLPDTTASVDHGAAESLLSEHKNSSAKLLSPKKKAAPSAEPIRSPSAPLVGPKPSKPGAAAPSTPTRADPQLLDLPPRPQAGSIQSARTGSPATPALNSLTPIPETEAVAAPPPHSDTTHPAQPPVPPSSPLSEAPNSDTEVIQKPKRKRATRATEDASKRAKISKSKLRVDSEDSGADPLHDAQVAGPSAPRRTTRPRGKRNAAPS
ncbi:hypothetical protein FRC00_008548 [Tulasnella sp. 408]|nr:hypothetical protein FRC00_008548 [Tulasnella sp. 408]